MLRSVLAWMLLARTISFMSMPVASFMASMVWAISTGTLPDTPDTPEASPPMMDTLSMLARGWATLLAISGRTLIIISATAASLYCL